MAVCVRLRTPSDVPLPKVSIFIKIPPAPPTLNSEPTGKTTSLLAMFFRKVVPFIIASICLVSAIGQHHPSPDAQLTSTHVRVNTLIGKNGNSAVQCWQVEPPFGISQQAGTVGAKIQQLGNIKGATVVFFNQTAPTPAGLHAAPAPQ